MRRLTLWTLNAFTVLSLLLCVLAVAVWAVEQDGLRAGTSMSWQDRGTTIRVSIHEIELRSARIHLDSRHEVFVANAAPSLDQIRHYLMRALGPSGRPGIRRWSAQSTRWMWVTPPGVTRYEDTDRTGIDLYGMMGTFAALPLWRLVAWVVRSRRAAKAGCCLACSYDLTGNVSGICPECGAAVVRGNA